MSQNCPNNATVASQGQGPPGASSFNVEPVPLTETDSEEQAEVLDSLPLGAMDSDTLVEPWPIEEWRSYHPYWKQPNVLAHESIGECHSMVAEAILALEQPFPGDYSYPAAIHPERRFHVFSDMEMPDYLITDQLAGGEKLCTE